MLLEALNIFGLYISKFNNGKVKSFGAKERHREHFWESDEADNVAHFRLKLIPRPFWQSHEKGQPFHQERRIL